MNLKDFLARRRQQAIDREILNASVDDDSSNMGDDDNVQAKKRNRKKEIKFDDDVPAVENPLFDGVDEQPTPEPAPKTAKKTRKYKAKTKVVAQANADEVSSVEPSAMEHDESDTANWKNRKKKQQQVPEQQSRPPLSMKELLRSSVVVYSILVLILLLQSFVVVRQSFLYRAEYQQLNQLNEKERQLNIEWGRMLIEKQTFGSSAQIATRATMEMGMFSPSREQRIIITLPEKKSASSRP